MRLRRVLTATVAMMPLLVCGPATAQDPALGDITPYLMDQGAEEALARSAAPGEIGAGAGVWLLTRDGYDKVSESSNGFECFVGRSWSGPVVIGTGEERRVNPGAFDPEVRAPHCFNPAAVRSVLPLFLARTETLLSGMDALEMSDLLARQAATGELPLAEPGSMAYMMSPGQDLGPNVGSWRPHVMLYIPRLTNADWGIEGFSHDYPFVAEQGTPWAVAVVPMRRFSDGTQAPEQVTGR